MNVITINIFRCLPCLKSILCSGGKKKFKTLVDTKTRIEKIAINFNKKSLLPSCHRAIAGFLL
jgi:hypothetical protein